MQSPLPFSCPEPRPRERGEDVRGLTSAAPAKVIAQENAKPTVVKIDGTPRPVIGGFGELTRRQRVTRSPEVRGDHPAIRHRKGQAAKGIFVLRSSRKFRSPQLALRRVDSSVVGSLVFAMKFSDLLTLPPRRSQGSAAGGVG